MYLEYAEFFKRFPHLRGKGKLYGGHCTIRRLMVQLEQVLHALSRQTCFYYYIEDANCDMYHQRIVYVARA